MKSRKNTEIKNIKVVRTKKGQKNALSKYTEYDSKRFFKGKEASRLLSSLGIKTSLSKIPLTGPLLLLRY